MKKLSAAERREQIIAAAMPLFADKGFDAVTTKEVAAVAGVSEALLYRHFGSKEALYQEILSSCVGLATEEVQTLNKLPDDTATLVLCIYAMMAKIQRCGEDPHTSALRRLNQHSLLQDGEFAKLFENRTAAPWIEKMRRCLSAAIEAGDITIPADEARLALWMGHHASVTFSHFKIDGKSIIDYPFDTTQVLEKSVKVVLRSAGMTDEAIKSYYRPHAFALLLSQG